MDAQRQAAFRQRLQGLIAGLKINREDPRLRALIGSAGRQLVADANAATWKELKQRLDAASYDKILVALQESGADMARRGETKAVRAYEVLGVSLVARHQTDADLEAALETLDGYIENCIAAARKVAAASASA